MNPAILHTDTFALCEDNAGNLELMRLGDPEAQRAGPFSDEGSEADYQLEADLEEDYEP